MNLQFFEEEMNSADRSPDSAGGDGWLSSCEMPCRGSEEKDCSSQSSGEIVMRGSSFSLDEQISLVVSSPEESFHSAGEAHRTLPGKANLLSTTMLVHEKSSEVIKEENTDQAFLNVTFSLAHSCGLHTEENDPASSSLVALPNENEGGLQMTFICETSTICRKESDLAAGDSEHQSYFVGAVTPEQGPIFVTTQFAGQKSDKGFHTSTPVQNIVNMTPGLTSFLDSPCNAKAVSLGLHPARPKQVSASPAQHVVAGLSPCPNKVKKMEIKKFPKSDYSHVKSKLMTRASNLMAKPSSTFQRKPSQKPTVGVNTEGEAWNDRRSRLGEEQLSPILVTIPRPNSLWSRPKLGTFGRDESRTSKAQGTPLPKQKTTIAFGGAKPKSAAARSVSFKAELFSTPGKTTGPALTTPCKHAAVSTSKGAANSTTSTLKRSGSARPTSNAPVDKTRQRTSAHEPPTSHPAASKLNRSHGPADVVPPADGKDDTIRHLKALLEASNCRFQAVAIVLQQTLAQRDEATKRCGQLSQELVNLQGELVSSLGSSTLLEKDKEELRFSLEDSLQKMREQHQKELSKLEQRLRLFYQDEWDKARLADQEEADKCKTLMEQQREELKANHEAMKLELERSRTEQLQGVKQQYEESLEELKRFHKQELQAFEETFKDAEASLSVQIQELTEENKALMGKLTAEEGSSRDLSEKTQRDSHTVYLEQELQSLKVVLDMKTEQLHHQEKLLMEIQNLTEKNVKMDESLKRVQQENEDLKARMERHTALSRQLSSEQAMLQESLQKEFKVNKRLSIENEELQWKLHNGDPNSHRKVSPSSSPSHSFSLRSPSSSGLFSSPPISPR